MNSKYLIGMCMLVMLASIGTVSAEKIINENQKVPIYGYMYNPCNGEYVLIQGDVHIKYTLDIDPDGSYKYSFQENYQGVTGTGIDPATWQETGTKYQVTGGYNYQLKGEGYLGYEVTNVVNMHIVSQGSDENYNVHYNIKFIVNEDGTVDWKVDNLRSECSK